MAKQWSDLPDEAKRVVLYQARTISEKRLEKALTKQALRFETQVPVGPYFIDFGFSETCTYHALAIEIDGRYHLTSKQQEKDTIRDQWLEKHGWHVLHFSNEEVEADLGAVMCKIFQKHWRCLKKETRYA